MNSSSSCIYITACFRAGARHLNVQDNTLYLAALCSPHIVSRGRHLGWGRLRKYVPAESKLLQPTCMAAWLLAPFSSMPMSGDIHKWARRVLLLPFKKAACAPCVKRFGQWPEAVGWDAPAILFGFSFSAWLFSLEDFPCTMLLSLSKTSSLPGGSHYF